MRTPIVILFFYSLLATKYISSFVLSPSVSQQTTAFDANYLSSAWSLEGIDCDIRSLFFDESGSVDIFENGSLSNSTLYNLVENGFSVVDLGYNPHSEGSFYKVTQSHQPTIVSRALGRARHCLMPLSPYIPTYRPLMALR